MEFIAVTYRSRAHTLRFHEFLKDNGIYSEIINTPKEAGVGCGLSVKTDPKYFSAIKKAVRITELKSFAGFFLVKNYGGKRSVTSI
ncbi:MAG: DUF3343 domain-containing protein [Clostridia bacterium]|nr:DUF3343 domain-containing protein [Clostridia bacterium]